MSENIAAMNVTKTKPDKRILMATPINIEAMANDTHSPAKINNPRVCKKICVNDILPMTYKGNYHGHTQQVCKRLSAITY